MTRTRRVILIVDGMALLFVCYLTKIKAIIIIPKVIIKKELVNVEDKF